MGSRRTLITVAAIAVGALAVFLIYGYVGSVKDEAFGEAERVKVYVVKAPVPKGTYGEEAAQGQAGQIVEDEIPKKFFPPNAIRTLDDIAGKVAVSDLAVNQIVTTDMFADPAVVRSSFADRLEKINKEDQVAITISIDEVHGVAGLLQPGDYVNIMATDVCQPASTDGGTTESADTGAEGCSDSQLFASQARYVYQKVQILAIGQTPVPQAGEVSAAGEGEDADAAAAAATENTGLITLIVPTQAAQVIASIPAESFYLTLVSRDYKPVPQEQLDTTAALPAEDATQLTPYGPAGPDGE